MAASPGRRPAVHDAGSSAKSKGKGKGKGRGQKRQLEEAAAVMFLFEELRVRFSTDRQSSPPWTPCSFKFEEVRGFATAAVCTASGIYRVAVGAKHPFRGLCDSVSFKSSFA